MEKVYIGKIVSTHGIKGEIRILSDFPYKNRVFIPGNRILIDSSEYMIESYRVHKKYDMIVLDGYHDINDVQFLLRKKVYVDKNSLSLGDDEVLDEDLLNYKVVDDEGRIGTVEEIFLASRSNKIIRVLFEKEVLIPLTSPMIAKIDKKKECIYVKLVDGM